MKIVLFDDAGKEIMSIDPARTNDMLLELLIFYADMDKRALEILLKGMRIHSRSPETMTKEAGQQ